MKQTNEAFWWSLFSGGGLVAALVVPALVVATGLILPWLTEPKTQASYDNLHAAVTWWPMRAALFVVVFLSLFHCGHRIRHVLVDLGLKGASRLLAVLCYGAALAGTVITATVLVRM